LTTSHRTVELFLKDLQTNPEHLALPWNVEKMAHSCGLGVTQFIHHVKSLVNMTPVHFLIECRIDLAKKILQKRPKASITETAMECGFSSGQYFATVFARQLGVSPREYARSFATVT
jgi:AraC-like DNA-binding protein